MRYTGSRCKRCRALGASLCGRVKCAFIKRPTPPGQHGASRKKISDFGAHLMAKQKIRWTYDLSEKQFYNLYVRATKSRDVTGTVLLQLLECRLDNIVYRGSLAATRRHARQLVSHGHVLVNGKKLDIPSAHMKPGDIVSIAQDSKKNLKETLPPAGIIPAWLSSDFPNLAVTLVSVPARDDIDQTLNENLVIEYYSR